MENITQIIKQHLNLSKDICNIIDVGRDGNCFYRTLSLYFTGDESHYKIIRQNIYLAAKDNTEYLRNFFNADQNDPILVNKKLEGYIETIKEDYFFAGAMEIYLAVKIFNINIAIYERNTELEDFTQYALFSPESGTEETVIVNFENRSHYNLITIKNTKQNNTKLKNIEEINKSEILKENTNITKNAMYHFNKNEYELNNGKYIEIGDNKNYYDEIYTFLHTKEKAKFKTKDGEIFIKWDQVKYPENLINDAMSQNQKDKKRYNFRQKCRNYLIENNILYFTGYGGKNNIKLRIPFYNEKKNILEKAHNNTGHLGINRTNDKIKELGYFWECMNEDVKAYIKDCPKCIMVKAGKNIVNKPKVIVSKGPLERVVIDGWELDEDLKEVTTYTWVIDMIDHFSKFLLSKPVKNNNAENIFLYFKLFFNTIGYPKIIQTDNGTEYKNNIINNLLTSNNIEHIFSSPRHPQTNGVVEVVHKEVRKNILYNRHLIKDDISFENIVLDSVLVHNMNIHTITGYKPSFLIKNDDKEVYEAVIEKIKQIYKIDLEINNNYYILNEGDHLLTKNGPYRKGKVIKCRKTKYKTQKLSLTVLKNYYCGIINVRVDANLYNFNKNEVFMISPKDCKIINEKEWESVINDISKDNHDNKNKTNDNFKKQKKNLKYRK